MQSKNNHIHGKNSINTLNVKKLNKLMWSYIPADFYVVL